MSNSVTKRYAHTLTHVPAHRYLAPTMARVAENDSGRAALTRQVREAIPVGLAQRYNYQTRDFPDKVFLLLPPEPSLPPTGIVVVHVPYILN